MPSARPPPGGNTWKKWKERAEEGDDVAIAIMDTYRLEENKRRRERRHAAKAKRRHNTATNPFTNPSAQDDSTKQLNSSEADVATSNSPIHLSSDSSDEGSDWDDSQATRSPSPTEHVRQLNQEIAANFRADAVNPAHLLLDEYGHVAIPEPEHHQDATGARAAQPTQIVQYSGPDRVKRYISEKDLTLAPDKLEEDDGHSVDFDEFRRQADRIPSNNPLRGAAPSPNVDPVGLPRPECFLYRTNDLMKPGGPLDPFLSTNENLAAAARMMAEGRL